MLDPPRSAMPAVAPRRVHLRRAEGRVPEVMLRRLKAALARDPRARAERLDLFGGRLRTLLGAQPDASSVASSTTLLHLSPHPPHQQWREHPWGCGDHADEHHQGDDTEGTTEEADGDIAAGAVHGAAVRVLRVRPGSPRDDWSRGGTRGGSRRR
jgi:hypothetical protein